MELTELEKRVIAELAELRCENFAAITNSVTEDLREPAELSLIQSTFENLVRDDLVLVGVSRDGSRLSDELSKEASMAVLEEIDKHLRFKTDAGRWTGGKEPWPELLVTGAGLAKGEEVLQQRGERWWLRSQ